MPVPTITKEAVRGATWSAAWIAAQGIPYGTECGVTHPVERGDVRFRARHAQHGQIDDHHLMGGGEPGHVGENRATAHIRQHDVVRLGQRIRGSLQLPPLRVRAAPRRVGEHTHPLPLGDLPVQRRAIDVAERCIEILQGEAGLMFDAEQHVESAAVQIGVEQCALDAPGGQGHPRQRHQRARADATAGRREHDEIAGRIGGAE